MPPTKRILVAATALAAAAATAGTAAASISGPCSANIAGAAVADLSGTSAGDAIHVSGNAIVPVTMSSPSAISHLKVVVSMAGFHWTVKDEPASGTSWTRTVNVHDYARWGVGLYQVTGSSASAAGGATCSGTALVRVGGNPLTTVAGIGGLAAALLGALGLLAAVGPLRLRAGIGPVAGFVGGALLGAGVLTLLQQYSLVYPTRGVALTALLAGIVVGAILPVIAHVLATGGVGHTPGGRPVTGH